MIGVEFLWLIYSIFLKIVNHHNLQTIVKDYSINLKWHIPFELQQAYHILLNHIHLVSIPIFHRQDIYAYLEAHNFKRFTSN